MNLPKLYQTFKRFLRQDRGATAVEYAVMLLVITLTLLSAIQILGPALVDTFSITSNAFDTTE